MVYHLAIDIGASSGRHILGWLENGIMKTEEIYRFANLPKSEGTGENRKMTWDTDSLFKEIVNGLKKAKEIGKIPATVGVDTWGVDYVLLDKDDKKIGETYCYRDGRTKKTIPLVHGKMSFAELFKRTGIQFQPYNTVYQLYDDLLSGKMEKAETYMNLPDYFHYLLTGVKKQEYSMAATTGMVNTKTHAWDEEIVSALGYKKSLFVPLTDSGSVVGEFSEETAKEIGYKATVVLPATHDTASAVISAPLKEQTPYISSGTWSILGVEQDEAYTNERALELNYSNEAGANGTFRLQQNIMGLWIIQQIRHELNDKYSFQELTEMAKAEPSDDLIEVNDDKFLAPESMLDAVYSSLNGKPSIGETAYIVYNSLAVYYDKTLKGLEELTGKTYATVNIIGGGSKNALLNELTKKRTGKRIITGPTEGTAIGNLMMQMIGTGEIPDLKAGRRIVENSFDVNEI